MNHASLSRRSFLKTTAIAAAGATLGAHELNAINPAPIQHLGVQLWSVRDDMGKDPKGTVEALAKMGYTEVEGFGYNNGSMFGMPFKDYVSLLKKNGISMPSSHVMITANDYNESTKMLSDNAKRTIDDAAAVGQKYAINPYMGDAERASIEKMVKAYTAAAEYAQKAGVRFGYHNHDFEFINRGPDGRLFIEWLLHEIDPKIMTMEMDLYWVCFANHNPLDWFRLYPGRWELCHAKDMAKTEKRESIEVGDGSIDFTTIFKQSTQAGLKYYIIELENYLTTPLQGVDRARQNLLKVRF